MEGTVAGVGDFCLSYSLGGCSMRPTLYVAFAVFAACLCAIGFRSAEAGDKPDQVMPDQVRPDQCKPDQVMPDQCVQKTVRCCPVQKGSPVQKCCPTVKCAKAPCPPLCCKPCCKPSIIYDDKCKRVYCCPGVGQVVIVKDCGWRLRAHKALKTNRRACRDRCG